MKKLLLVPFLAAFLLTGCKYDDGDLWDTVNDHEQRLEDLEAQVLAMNNEITTVETLVGALEGQDRITSVTPLPDGSGYSINFLNRSPITITNGRDGAAAPAVSMKAENGTYYWTLGGQWLLNDAGQRMTVSGVAPQVRINSSSLQWEISTDGGTTWNSTGVAATGSSSESLFSDVQVATDKVTFTLSNGTSFDLPRTAAPTLAFSGLDADNVFAVPADGNDYDITLTASADITRVGIASPNPVPTGWSWTAATDKITVSATGVVAKLDVLVVATTAAGASASYWITFSPVVQSGTDLQTAINALVAAGGGELQLEAGTYTTTTGTLTFSNAVTIKGASSGQTVLNTAISASAPVNLEDLTVSSATSPVVNITTDVPFVGTGIVLQQTAAGTGDNLANSKAAITSQGDVELYDSTIDMDGTAYVRAINAYGDVLLDGTTITTGSVAAASNATYSRGINLLGANQTVTLQNGAALEGFYYPLNVASGTTGATVIVDGATLDGYCAINVWMPCTITVKNNSTLIGRNLYPAGSSDFGVIVLNSGATNAQVTVTDSTLQTVVTNTSVEYLVLLGAGADNNTIQFLGNTVLADGTSALDYMVQDRGTGNTVTAVSTVTLTGKTSVALVQP